MKRIEINWAWVFWISITILFLWLMAKGLGFIHTPLIIEIIPYLTGFTAIVGFSKSIAKFLAKIDVLFSDVKDMKLDIKEIKQDVSKLDNRVSILESGMNEVKSRLSKIENKLKI